MKIYRGKTQKILILGIVALVVLGFSIGFSAFSSSLVIKSNLNVNPDSATFGVVFSSSPTSLSTNEVVPTLTPNTATASNAKIVNSSIPTISNFSIEFNAPGDKAQYVFYARNTGEYDAYLTSIIFENSSGGSSNKVCTPIEGTLESDIIPICNNIKLTVQVGTKIYTKTEQVSNHKLGKGSSEQVIITVEFIDDGTDYADSIGDFIVKFGDISLFYSSQDNGASSIASSEIVGEGNTVTLYNKTLVENYQIYGNANGVGDLDNSTGKYIIPIIVTGANLFDYKRIKSHDYLEVTDDGLLLKNGYSIGTYITPEMFLEMTGLKEGDDFSFSNKSELIAGVDNGVLGRVVFLSTGVSTNGAFYLASTGNVSGIKTVPTGFNSTNYTAMYIYGAHSADSNNDWKALISNIMVSKNTSLAYEPYFEPKYYNVFLSSPLMEGEYIDYNQQAVIASDGSIKERIEVPKLQINNSGTSIITINTINSPNNIKLIYY